MDSATMDCIPASSPSEEITIRGLREQIKKLTATNNSLEVISNYANNEVDRLHGVLKDKNQEIESLKAAYSDYGDVITGYEEDTEKLKQKEGECEKLKSDNDLANEAWETAEENLLVSEAQIETLKKEVDDMKTKMKVQAKELEEAKEEAKYARAQLREKAEAFDDLAAKFAKVDIDDVFPHKKAKSFGEEKASENGPDGVCPYTLLGKRCCKKMCKLDHKGRDGGSSYVAS